MSDQTLEYYEKHAQEFFDKTVNCDLSDIYPAFLEKIPKHGLILDFGCGSGRDSKYFHNAGYQVDATDGPKELCRIASQYTKLNVRQLLFEELHEQVKYDGIWASCSIMHANHHEIPNILQKMSNALKPNGVIYTCFKLGNDHMVKNKKYYTLFEKSSFENLLKDLPELTLYKYFENLTRKAPHEEIWGNYYLQKSPNS